MLCVLVGAHISKTSYKCHSPTLILYVIIGSTDNHLASMDHMKCYLINQIPSLPFCKILMLPTHMISWWLSNYRNKCQKVNRRGLGTVLPTLTVANHQDNYNNEGKINRSIWHKMMFHQHPLTSPKNKPKQLCNIRIKCITEHLASHCIDTQELKFHIPCKHCKNIFVGIR